MDYKETYEKILGEYRQVFERVDELIRTICAHLLTK